MCQTLVRSTPRSDAALWIVKCSQDFRECERGDSRKERKSQLTGQVPKRSIYTCRKGLEIHDRKHAHLRTGRFFKRLLHNRCNQLGYRFVRIVS